MILQYIYPYTLYYETTCLLIELSQQYHKNDSVHENYNIIISKG